MAKVKQFTRWTEYDKLSEEQRKEFKKALFLTKGAANNNVGCMLAYYGLDAETIARIGASWKDAKDVDQGACLHKSNPQFTKLMKQARKLLEQQYERVPQLFETIRGRYLIAKFGEDIKQDFCNENGDCAISVVDPRVNPMGEYAKDRTLERTAGGSYELGKVIRHLENRRCVDFDVSKKYRLEFLTRINPVENAKAAAKGFDLGSIYTASLCISQSSYGRNVRLDKYPELEKDFWGLISQDLYGLANAPMEQFKKLLDIGEDVDLKKAIGPEVSIIGHISEQLTSRSFYGSESYSAHPDAIFNALFVRALYTAMDEMGVGIAASQYVCRYRRGHFKTRVSKIARKVISLNEKYQKMLKNKSNSIEPAVLRDTLVGMYNEWADRSCIEYRMFVREDRPAPTLAELKPAKKAKTVSKATTRASKKASTEPKVTVEVEGVGTFVEY